MATLVHTTHTMNAVCIKIPGRSPIQLLSSQGDLLLSTFSGIGIIVFFGTVNVHANVPTV